MIECPTPVSKKQLEELFIQVRPDLPQRCPRRRGAHRERAGDAISVKSRRIS
jgi:hypothetical protein